MKPQYPVYVISKGRSNACLTARFLLRDGVPFHLVVEPQEQADYVKEFGEEPLLVLPFSNLGSGSIPARNFVWEHSKALGSPRHWILDDNIAGIWRRYRTRKIRCAAGPALRVVEDLSDRYENVALAGLNYYMFSVNKLKQPPFCVNVHVYSCILVANDLPFRWRGRYNEDSDLCLQALSAGWCTILVNAFLAWKMTTMTMGGGNTDDLYQGEGRLKMARSLERMWPGVVETKRRFGRPQHVVNWAAFDTPLRLKEGIDLDALPANEYGLDLTAVREPKSAAVKELLREASERR